MWWRVHTSLLSKLRVKPWMRFNQQSWWSLFLKRLKLFKISPLLMWRLLKLLKLDVQMFPRIFSTICWELPLILNHKTISSFKLSYVSGMWRTLCECITQFSVESLENLKELEIGVASILNGLREVYIINLNPLEVLLEDYFKKHRDYDVARPSTSQKITRDSHQELL